jgi:asparagine synthase (glutamine-hydrolysing)
MGGGPGGGLRDEDGLRAATQALRHRGPDAQGLARLPGALLGHTRLRVIDLTEAGAQPMRSDDGAITVTYNGEIYNHHALRAELSARGHRFRSRCDTEVLVAGYREWGEGLPERLDGMFAFAVWDAPRRRLLLCRDRAGEKPLFYHFDPATGALRFASEIKALPPLGAPLALRHAGLPMLLSYGYVPAPETLYEGVCQLPPACRLILQEGGGPRVEPYWRPRFASEPRATLSEPARARVRQLMIDAVRTRLESDVPLGAFLSGGIDSSIVVGVLSRLLGRRVKTFSIGFSGDARFDETHYAREVARAFETEHTEFTVTPTTFALGPLVEELVWLHDGPFGDSSAIPTYMVAKLAREHVTVALTGDGGDELFCGYPRMIAAEAAEYVPPAALRLAGRLGDLLPRVRSERSAIARAKRFLSAASLPMADRVARWSSMFLSDLAGLFRPEWRDRLDLEAPLAYQRDLFARARAGSPLGRVLDNNFSTYLPYDVLLKVDRTAMAHALETRAPFLARDLIEYAATLPDGYRRQGRRMKQVLREAFSDILPASVLGRGKMGFGIPLGTWFRDELRDFLLAHLQPGAQIFEYLDPARAQVYLREHLAGQADHSHRLFTLLTMEVWLRAMPAWRAA